MPFTNAEKIQIAMICDLAKPVDERELDFDFIWRSVMNGDEWALRWKYSDLELQGENPSNVSLVVEIFEMWDRLERGFEQLDDNEKRRVLTSAYDVPKPYFHGFDGNNEGELLHIARVLVDDLKSWSRFKGRDLDAHMPCIDSYLRILAAWRPLWAKKIESGLSNPALYDATADELIMVLRERIHPQNRQMNADGTWTLRPSQPKKA